jgi:uncharacterized cupin superfamily protein
MSDSADQGPIAIKAADAAPRAKPSNYPEPFFSRMLKREKRPLGDLFGLKAGAGRGIRAAAPAQQAGRVRLYPGGRTDPRHRH